MCANARLRRGSGRSDRSRRTDRAAAGHRRTPADVPGDSAGGGRHRQRAPAQSQSHPPTAADGDVDSLSLDVCATWAAVKGLLPEFQAICRHNKTLVICDEHHHAAVEAAWGNGAGSAFQNAKYVVVLTGTPIRSDGEATVWLAFDSNGKIDHPDDSIYHRVANCDQAVDRAKRHSVDELLEKIFHEFNCSRYLI